MDHAKILIVSDVDFDGTREDSSGQTVEASWSPDRASAPVAS